VLGATRVVLRPIANGMALGFLGLAGASGALATMQLGWVAASQRHQMALIVLVVAPLPQLLSSIFGFLGRDAIAASGMGWLSATWLAYGLVMATTPVGTTSPALGAYLVIAGIGLALISIGSDGKGVASWTIAINGLRFLASAVFELSSSTPWERVAGVVGLVICALALYAALALALEDLRRRPVLPTLRRGEVREMFDEPLAEQVRSVAGEAGVRRQL
jgi:succinate-acetate transporter protein